jgi:hypothetical protein
VGSAGDIVVGNVAARGIAPVMAPSGQVAVVQPCRLRMSTAIVSCSLLWN